MLACPYNVPRYEWTQAIPSVRKCDMCIDRQRAGKVTGCTEACPVEATTFGRRDDLLVEAHRRIDESPDDYYPHVFGEHELGGTSVLFLASVEFAALGFPDLLGTEPMPELTRKALKKIPSIVVLGGTALFAVHWITKRRELVAAAEAEEPQPKTSGNGTPDDTREKHHAK
jgi:formate dehydrogenase iron-sulfur subunit